MEGCRTGGGFDSVLYSGGWQLDVCRMFESDQIGTGICGDGWPCAQDLAQYCPASPRLESCPKLMGDETVEIARM